jgi:radical SAM protein with 4Fe4S-binding SPASM domain
VAFFHDFRAVYDMIPHKRAIARLSQITWNYWIRKRTVVGYKPYRIWVEPTSKCNLACVMCPNRKFQKSELGFMDFDLYRSVIDQATSFVHDVNLHHRGESTLHPRLADMIRYADQKGMKVKLHTNGTTLNGDLSEFLIRSGLRLLSFSFDGYDAETYEKIRVRSDYGRTLRNIHRFLELKKKLGAARLRTVMELMDFKPDAVDPAAKRQFVSALKSRGLDRFIVKKPHNWAGSVGLKTFETSSFSACTFPWHALVVLWDGRVGSCPHDFFAEIVYGDIRNSSLEEIFNSSKIQSLRAHMLENRLDALESPCRTCDSVRRKRIAGIPVDSLKYLRD